jgi:hypothetical protein
MKWPAPMSAGSASSMQFRNYRHRWKYWWQDLLKPAGLLIEVGHVGDDDDDGFR